ncbi:MAG: ATP-binding protein, partial [Acidimicrobiia bacterium]
HSMGCLACGETTPAGARFCPQCGVPISTATSPAIEPALREQVLTNLRAEHRLVTVVFADMTSSVSRTVGLSAEEATDLVNPLLEAMVELMVRYGGRIDRFLGDGVLAVFGVPTAHEDDPIRAVRAALDLRDRAEELGLATTAGINTGRVYFGPVGSSLHEELTVMGPTVSLAARLQGAAGSGEVYLGESTREHVHRAFDLSSRTLTIKGIDEPVAAYRAERLLDEPDKVRGIEGLRAEMVGRRRELDTLMTRLGGGETVALVGPAGLGKSRLAAEFHVRATAEGYAWMEGRCLEHTTYTPYAPFADMLGRHLGFPRDPAPLLDDLAALVSSGALTAEKATEIAPFIVRMMGWSLGGDRDLPVTEATSDLRKRLTIDSLTTYLTARSVLAPVVVFVDDLHWADELSVDALISLHRASAGRQLILTAYRPESDTAATRLAADLASGLLSLALMELTEEQSREMIRDLLTVSGLPAELESRIVDQARGNPFYVEELIRSLIQRAVLVLGSHGWEATGPVDEMVLPESVEALVISRFDRLPIEARRAGQVASVIDQAFTEDVFTNMAGPELASRLAMLVSAGFLAPERLEPVTEYSFTHALTRQAIYSSLLPSQQSDLHERAGNAIAQLDPSDCEALAYHYERSDNHAQAVRHLFEAGRRAVDGFLTEAAHGYLERGLARVQLLPAADQPPWAARLRAHKGELLERMARHGEARSELGSALEFLADDPHQEAKICWLVGRTHRLEGEFDEAHLWYDRAERALDDLADRNSAEAHRGWLDIQVERAFALYFGGRGRELPQLNERVEPVAVAHGTPAQRSDYLRSRVLYGYIETRFVVSPTTVDLAKEGLALAVEGADPGRIANMRFVFGFALLWADRLEEALPVLEQAVTEAGRVGDLVLENRALVYRAVARRRAGLTDSAEEAAHQALECSSRLGNDEYAGHARGVLAWVHWRRGEVLAGREEGEAALGAWGSLEHDGMSGLETEFGWLAVWPLVAIAAEEDDWDTAAERLRLTRVPWERPTPPDLDTAIEQAIETPTAETITEAIALAATHRLL